MRRNRLNLNIKTYKICFFLCRHLAIKKPIYLSSINRINVNDIFTLEIMYFYMSIFLFSYVYTKIHIHKCDYQ